MQRHSIFCLLGVAGLAWLLSGGALGAQSPAVVAAERELIEDNYRRLIARIEQLEANQLAIQQQMSVLERAVRDLREEAARNATPAVSPEAVRKLAEQIQRVDDTRVAENKRLVEAIENLHRILKEAASAPPPLPRHSSSSATTRDRDTTPSGGGGVEEGFEYKIQPGDHLGKIVTKYREQGVKVTSKMIMDANPKVKWEKLQPGQKIFVPKPKD